MLRNRAVCLVFLAACLPITVLAQSEPELTPPKWTSNTSTDPTGTRTCAVFPLREGAYPMIFFYGSEREGQLSIEGSSDTPFGLTLKVDANAELDGGFPLMSTKDTATLIKQIRADGQTLRLSQSALVDRKLQRFDLDLPLAGAVEHLDKCRAWLARSRQP